MMRKCPRCHSSMLMDHDASINGRQRTWKCLGCGREIYADASVQGEGDALLANIRGEVVRQLQP